MGSESVDVSEAAAEISGAGGSVWVEAVASGLPHSGQNIAGSRTAAPHDEQRSEISGCTELLPITNC
jgi:hypothetical protein